LSGATAPPIAGNPTFTTYPRSCFLRNRFNIAVWRAQSLAVVVVNPRLLDADCRTLESMRLVDGACRFVEIAAPINLPQDALLGGG
jgi:hypothetical protein